MNNDIYEEYKLISDIYIHSIIISERHKTHKLYDLMKIKTHTQCLFYVHC